MAIGCVLSDTINRITMNTKGHYVSKFHLKQFTDPDSIGKGNVTPWVWLGMVPDGPVKRKGPENFAHKRGMFDGPGGLVDRNATLEAFLASEVEGPAADAMKEVCGRPRGSGGELPPALFRYLAWAAARSLPMQRLESQWAAQFSAMRNTPPAEPPPDGLLAAVDLQRDVQWVHPSLGTCVFPAGTDFDRLADKGWYPDPSEAVNFLEMVHVQAFYFQARFFPRFRWFTLHAPEDKFFVIADRAVGWAADGYLDAPPNCLRDRSAYVLAPLSRSLVLVGRHTTDAWNVTPAQVNAVIAAWAHEWIAGPTEHTVTVALDARRKAIEAVAL